MKVLGIIPARYNSSRLPGKPLVDIFGKPMIQHVYERASESIDQVLVATDDERIEACVKAFGGNVVMTSTTHNTGTNRCLEAYQKSNLDADIIINIQGDEPLLEPNQLREITSCFKDESVSFATLVFPAAESELIDGDGVYVVLNQHLDAVYFSRSVVPHIRDQKKAVWSKHHQFYKHVGMYAYTPVALERFASMEQTNLELAESLEQLRWIENGYTIRAALTQHETIAVDTPYDLEKVKQIIQQK